MVPLNYYLILSGVLFSIGTVMLNPDGTQQLDGSGQPIPAYTQADVNNFARVFTGWRLATAPAPGVPNYIDAMVLNENQHDIGAKTLLVSGGFTFFTERLQTRLALDHTLSNVLEIADGREVYRRLSSD